MKKRRNYSPEFKLQSASLVLDSGYSLKDAAKAADVSHSAMRTWVKQLRAEREGITPEGSQAITEEQQQIQALQKRIKQLELDKEILKKASALLISDSYQSTH